MWGGGGGGGGGVGGECVGVGEWVSGWVWVLFV